MEELRVYLADYQDYYVLYRSQGAALDDIKAQEDRFVFQQDGDAFIGRIFYNKKDASMLNNGDIKVYQAKRTQPGFEFTWFVRMEDAQSYAADNCPKDEINGKPVVLATRYCSRVIAPVTLPITATLQRDPKGVLFARLNLHPERDGTSVQGKIYFVDKNWKEAHEGLAVVESVFDRPTYGFMKGHMVGYVLPDHDDFIDWLLSDGAPSFKKSDIIIIAKNTAVGDVIVITRNGISYRLGFTTTQDGRSEGFVLLRDSLAASYASSCGNKEVFDARDYILSNISDKFSYSRYWTRFPISEFGPKGSKNLLADWEPVDKSFDYDLMNEAIDCGMIQPMQLGATGVYIVELVEDNYRMMGKFGVEELEAIKGEAYTILEDANERIRSLLRKGKLRLATSFE